MTQPLISVIIPTYNRSSLIARAVQCVLAQTYGRIETIVVDDGSTDDTEAVLKAFGSSIRYVRQENAGPGAARNRGIVLAHGELVAFLDSDDSWAPAKIERQVRLIDTAGPAVPCCLCNALLRFSDGSTRSSFENALIAPSLPEGIWDNPTDILITRFLMFNQMFMARRSVLERVGGFNERFRCLEDYDLALRLSFEGPWAFISEPLVVWNQGSLGSLSALAAARQRHLRTTELEILRGISQRLDATHAALSKTLGKRIHQTSRQLRAANMVALDSPPMRVLGQMLFVFERLRSSIERRLPGYPRMSVRPVPAAATLPLQECSPGEPLVSTQPSASSSRALRVDKLRTRRDADDA